MKHYSLFGAFVSYEENGVLWLKYPITKIYVGRFRGQSSESGFAEQKLIVIKLAIPRDMILTTLCCAILYS